MEGNKSKPLALLVFGAPCSGKSTFAEKFSKKFKIATYDLDELTQKNKFSREQLLVVVEQVLKTRCNVLFEGGLATEKDRIEIRNLAREQGYDPALIWIQTDVATIRQRLKSKFRSVKKAKEFYDSAVESIEAPTESEHAIILSGKHTFETQSRHVVSGLAGLANNK